MVPIKDQIVEPMDNGDGPSGCFALLLDQGWPADDARWCGPLIDALLSEWASSNADAVVEETIRTPSVLSAIRDVAGDGSSLNGQQRGRTLFQLLARLFVAFEFGPLSDRKRGCGVDWSPHVAKFRENGLESAGSLVAEGWPAAFGSAEKCERVLQQFVREHASQTEVPALVAFMRMLVETEALKLADVFEHRSFGSRCDHLQVEDSPGQPRQRSELDPAKSPPCEPLSLFPWMLVLGPKALESVYRRFEERFSKPPADDHIWEQDKEALRGFVDPQYADAILASLEKGPKKAAIIGEIRGSIETWLCVTARDRTAFGAAGAELALALRRYVELVGEELLQHPGEDDLLRRQWMWLLRCVLGADRDVWDSLREEYRAAAMRMAGEDMAAIRPLLADATPCPVVNTRDRDLVYRYCIRYNESPDQVRGSDEESRLVGRWFHDGDDPGSLRSWERFTWERDHLQTCVHLLFGAGGCWRAIKPSILAWRALKTRGIARDLRYWNESDREPVPLLWSDLFAWPISLFQKYAGMEQETDADLLKLRSEFGTFLLSRLVDRWSAKDREEAEREGRSRSNADMREPSPAWRYCSIRAFTSLFVNPEGKGQRVLRKSAAIDPEPQVREAANEAFQRLRRGLPSSDAVSPRRTVLSAMWWLRQAHLLALDVVPADPAIEVLKIDPDGAQRTRAKELSRTREPREGSHHPNPD